MKYILKVYRRLLRFKWFRNISSSFVENHHLVANKISNQEFTKQFTSQYGLKVIYGPFKGLKYPALESYGSALMPKLMGTYEHELHHIIEDLEDRKTYAKIIDIGAAEGYYAIGLAGIFTNTKVIAFETSEKARNLINEMASLNDVVSAIQIEGDCTIESLRDNLEAENGLIICDCEGFELKLLDPDKIQNLQYQDILVELHDYTSAGETVSEIMRKRFEKTHSFSFINIRRNKPMAHLNNFKKENIIQLANENRAYSIGWLFLEAKKIGESY